MREIALNIADQSHRVCEVTFADKVAVARDLIEPHLTGWWWEQSPWIPTVSLQQGIRDLYHYYLPTEYDSMAPVTETQSVQFNAEGELVVVDRKDCNLSASTRCVASLFDPSLSVARDTASPGVTPTTDSPS